jgi:hypothetical protein
VKTDAYGSEEWRRTFGGTKAETGYTVQQTIDGGYVIGARTDSFGYRGYDFWLIKTDANGNEEWNKTLGTTNDDFVDVRESVQQTDDGGYIVVGGTHPPPPKIWYDILVIKTDKNGKSSDHSMELSLTLPSYQLNSSFMHSE